MDAPLHIAVIEDHRLLHQVTVQLLRDQGHHVTGFFCAEELDDESSVFVPDLYVIDLNLPGEDGLSLARRIRASQPATGIIMVTARDSLEDRLQQLCMRHFQKCRFHLPAFLLHSQNLWLCSTQFLARLHRCSWLKR